MDLETEYAAIEPMAFPQAFPTGEQKELKSKLEQAYEVMQEELEAEL